MSRSPPCWQGTTEGAAAGVPMRLCRRRSFPAVRKPRKRTLLSELLLCQRVRKDRFRNHWDTGFAPFSAPETKSTDFGLSHHHRIRTYGDFWWCKNEIGSKRSNTEQSLGHPEGVPSAVGRCWQPWSAKKRKQARPVLPCFDAY
jgi:hypothetical protein